MAIDGISIALLFAIGILVSIGLFYWIWNTTVTDIFKLRRITLFESIKLLLITNILFGTTVSLVACGFNAMCARPSCTVARRILHTTKTRSVILKRSTTHLRSPSLPA